MITSSYPWGKSFDVRQPVHSAVFLKFVAPESETPKTQGRRGELNAIHRRYRRKYRAPHSNQTGRPTTARVDIPRATTRYKYGDMGLSVDTRHFPAFASESARTRCEKPNPSRIAEEIAALYLYFELPAERILKLIRISKSSLLSHKAGFMFQ